MAWVLGIGGYSHDASASLLYDGALVAAVQEERLTRVKHAGGFPYRSIEYCLKAGGIAPSDVSAVAFYTRKSNWDRYLADTIKASLRHPRYTFGHGRGFVASVGYRLYRSLSFRADLARFFLETGFDKRRFFDHEHHACHAASAFYVSPFDEAIVLCVDGGGDGRTTSGWLGRGNRLVELPLSIRHPHSLGLIYTRMTRHLGFPSPGDEYKVMGLAAYGAPTYLDQMRKMVELRDDGGYRLDMSFFNYQFDYSASERFYRTFGPARRKGEPVTERHADLAASVQRLFEEIVLHLCVALRKRTGVRALCLGGGSALNCTANGRLLTCGEFDSVFVPPAASDLGTSMGAALYHSYQMLGGVKRTELRTDAWGPEYSDAEIEEELQRAGLDYEPVSNPAVRAAELISTGKIVGWFHGRMEFGPRALGHRSILADPRQRDVKDRMNKTVKFREEFRPFAPSILRESAGRYFRQDADSPFMTFTFDVLPERREDIPGVVHVDGSARVQTVSRADEPLYYELIEHFYRLTGVPVVLNTSFNLAGEPIVCSPDDALRTTFTSGVDALVIGHYLVTKRR